MSQNASSGSSVRPPRSIRAIISLVLLGLVGVWLLVFLIQHGSAFAAWVRSDKSAKACLTQYARDGCSGDLNAALANADPRHPRAEVEDDLSDLRGRGALRELRFSESDYFKKLTPDNQIEREGWFFRGVAFFTHGSSEFSARVFQHGDQFKVHMFAIDPLPTPAAAVPPVNTTQAAEPDLKLPPEMALDATKNYTATIHTAEGAIVVDLFAKAAPVTVNNFVHLARAKFYDGLSFHRVIPDFMIQGGDPMGTGAGGPGYCFADEVDPAKNDHVFQTGSLAMANSGPNTNGSQFFITYKPTPWLQGKHTIFGQVHDAKSQAVVNAIHRGDTMTSVVIEER